MQLGEFCLFRKTNVTFDTSRCVKVHMFDNVVYSIINTNIYHINIGDLTSFCNHIVNCNYDKQVFLNDCVYIYYVHHNHVIQYFAKNCRIISHKNCNYHPNSIAAFDNKLYEKTDL